MRRSVINKPMELRVFNNSHAASPLSAVMQRIPSSPRISANSSRASLSSSTINTRWGVNRAPALRRSAPRARHHSKYRGRTYVSQQFSSISQHTRQTSAEGRSMCTSSESLPSGRSTGFDDCHVRFFPSFARYSRPRLTSNGHPLRRSRPCSTITTKTLRSLL